MILNSLGCEQISVTATLAIGATVPAGCQAVIIGVDTAAVRFSTGGAAPTTTLGVSLGAGSVSYFEGLDIANIRFCSTSGTAKVNMQYFG